MAKKKPAKKSGAKKARTGGNGGNAPGLGSRILDRVREEIEQAGETVVPEDYNKQVVIRGGGGYMKGNYSKGDAYTVRQPPPGYIRLDMDVKLKKGRQKRKRSGK
jgi:hypothetical protein